MKYKIVLNKTDEGYSVSCPGLPGCWSQGETEAEAIENINEDSGLTTLISEQYARPILPIVDYCYVLENGTIVLEGTGSELMENPDVKAAYFGV